MLVVKELQKLASNYSVLYVEDDPAISEETKRVLDQLFKSVRTATDGQEGLALYQRYRDDIVITDVNMPKLSGLEMSRKIREFDPNVPIIIFSAFDDKEKLMQAIDYGISQYVIKPLDMKAFLHSLKKVLVPLHLEKKIIRLNNRLKDILNTMEDLVVSYKGDHVTVANRHFLDFFGIDSMKQLLDKPFDLSQALVREKGYTFADHWEGFISKVRSGNETVVKIYDKANTRYRKFLVRYNPLSSNPNESMLTLTDISHLSFLKSGTAEKSMYDTLTKIYTRSYIYKLLESEMLRAEESGNPLHVLMIDIDRFGEINKHFGYAAGDKVIKELVDVVKGELQDSSMHLGRWGGDVFVVIASDHVYDDVIQVAEAIGQKISGHRFEAVGQLSCSMGISAGRENDSADSLMVRTGAYVAKSKRSEDIRIETDRTRTSEELDRERDREEIVFLFKDLIENEEKIILHNFYKGLPIKGEGTPLHIGSCNNMALTLKQSQVQIIKQSKEVLLIHPKLPLAVRAEVNSVSERDMIVTLSAFEYVKSSPIERAVIRFEPDAHLEVSVTKGMNRIGGQLIDISSRSLAFHTFSLSDFVIRDDVIVELDLPLNEKQTLHYKTSGKVIMVSPEGEFFKVVVLLFNSKQSEAVLQQYLADKQLALTQEILNLSL